jgi:hypothetical protein
LWRLKATSPVKCHPIRAARIIVRTWRKNIINFLIRVMALKETMEAIQIHPISELIKNLKNFKMVGISPLFC